MCFVFSIAQHLREVELFWWEKFLQSAKNLKIISKEYKQNEGIQAETVEQDFHWRFLLA